jgi:hypothetical protein
MSISRVDLVLSAIMFLLGSFYVVTFYILPFVYWTYCYISALACGTIFLVRRRESFFTLSSIFIVLSIIGLTLAVGPSLFFDVGVIDLRLSIYLNSLGIIFFVAAALLASPYRVLRFATGWRALEKPAWLVFFKVNWRIFLFTLPGVLLVITLSGGWSVFSMSLQDSGFDRTASLKGMGPLMIFSSLNVLSGILCGIGLWVRGWKIVSILFVFSLITLNSFTYGRGNLIALVTICLTFYGLSRGFSLKAIAAILFSGVGIVLLQVLRAFGSDKEDYGYSSILVLLNKFAGDFDTVINTSQLIDYVEQNDYFGMYHIWSTVYQFIPRFVFPDKPQFFADVYINSLIFPGVYLGAEGGTTFTFGVVGVWYAVAGMATMIFGMVLQAVLMGGAERIFLSRAVRSSKPNFRFVVYLILVSQVVIMYRVGFYPFMNAILLIIFYYTYYQLLKRTV